jgi:hypothetical protein
MTMKDSIVLPSSLAKKLIKRAGLATLAIGVAGRDRSANAIAVDAGAPGRGMIGPGSSSAEAGTG